MSRPNRGQGFALVAALWAVTLLSTIALAVGLEQRSRRLAALNRVDEARASAAADAGLAHARAVLTRLAESAERATDVPDPGAVVDPWWHMPGMRHDTVDLGDAWYSVSYEDPGARLNLNRADEEELGRLMIALRVDAREADLLAQRIMDWRDAHDAHRARGAEQQHYLAAAMPLLPTNRPFAAVAEVRHVLGMTTELFDRLSSHLTVEGSGRIAVHAAPPEVLLALPGMTPEAVIALLRLRRDGRRLGHLSELGAYLSAGPRAEFMSRLPQLMGRITLESSEMVAVAEAGVAGGPLRVAGRALFIRSAGMAHSIETRIE